MPGLRYPVHTTARLGLAKAIPRAGTDAGMSPVRKIFDEARF
jgi:hypothetical protein